MMKKIVNLTQFPATVETISGGTTVLPKAGAPAFLKSSFSNGGTINGLPVTNGKLAPEVPGLPEPEEGTLLLVPAITGMVLAAEGREDILVPGPINRDEKGRITSYKGLARPGKANPFKIGGADVEEGPVSLEGVEFRAAVKHSCTILGDNGDKIVIPGADSDARVVETWGDEGTLTTDEGEKIALYSLSYKGEIVGLPEPEEGVVYVVSLITAQIAKSWGRTDLLSPGKTITDPNDVDPSGRPRIIGAQGFTRSI